MGTRHGKQHQFAPPFAEILGAVVVTPPDLDTDRFGTFSGERPRETTAIDAARAKARLAMSVTGLPRALATEASYGLMPALGWHGHEEIAIFVDDVVGIEVLEGHRSPVIPGFAQTVSGAEEIPPDLLAGLPDQALIVRPAGPAPGAQGIVKGITDVDALRDALAAAAVLGAGGRAVVEPDLRAHHNPTRREVLSSLAYRLACRIATGCPACDCPGFGRVETTTGLPCLACGGPTPLPCNEIHSCGACGHTISRSLATTAADPAMCPDCNP